MDNQISCETQLRTTEFVIEKLRGELEASYARITELERVIDIAMDCLNANIDYRSDPYYADHAYDVLYKARYERDRVEREREG